MLPETNSPPPKIDGLKNYSHFEEAYFTGAYV